MLPESSPPIKGQYTPPGWIPLRTAFERLGEYQFADAWTGKEFEALTTRGVEGQKRAFELRISEIKQLIETNKRTAERRARPQAVESGDPRSSPLAVVSAIRGSPESLGLSSTTTDPILRLLPPARSCAQSAGALRGYTRPESVAMR